MERSDSGKRVLRPLCLLLIDDNPRDRDLLARELRDYFGVIELEPVRNEAEFALALAAQSFDAVIVDYQLHWTTGLDVLRRVKAERTSCPVIMFTASGSEQVAVEGMKEGLDDYITKSVKHYGRLPFAVAAALERVQQREELRRALSTSNAWAEQASVSQQWLRIALRAAGMRAWQFDLEKDANGVDAPGWTIPAEGFGSVHPEDIPKLTAACQDAIESGKPLACEVRALTSDQREIWLEVRGEPLRSPQGKLVRLVGVTLDITERKRTEEALKVADRRKDAFLATLAHELRNPLAPIRYATRLLEPGVPEQMATDARRMIDRQLGHMARLLDDLLDVSRITRGVLEIERTVIDVRECIESAVNAARTLATAAGVNLPVSLGRVPLPVLGDSVRLTQVFGNLLSNAVKFTPAGGHIQVDADPGDPNEIVVSVRDDGIGIAPELLPRVFELFVQGHPTGSRTDGGLGIGLSLARELVELHDGRIQAFSKGSGLGSEFVLRLPRAAEKAAISEPVAEADKVVALGASQIRVLIIDDNVDAADALSNLLAVAGYQTSTAYNGEAGFAAAERLHPDILLIDIGMPDVSGHEIARRVRERPWGRNARLLAITGWGGHEDRERSQAAGFDDHLTKPVDPEALLQLIAKALRGAA